MRQQQGMRLEHLLLLAGMCTARGPNEFGAVRGTQGSSRLDRGGAHGQVVFYVAYHVGLIGGGTDRSESLGVLHGLRGDRHVGREYARE